MVPLEIWLLLSLLALTALFTGLVYAGLYYLMRRFVLMPFYNWLKRRFE